MAKIAYSKLKCKVNEEVATVELAPEVTIEVKQYLPIQEKLGLIGRVINKAHEQDTNYSNPVKAAVYCDLEVIFAYTNITFTEKQLEDLPKLYDQLVSSGMWIQILEAIPGAEYLQICEGVKQSIKAFYKYQNSVLGILDTIKTDYDDMNLDALQIREALGNPDNLSFLKEVLTKLG